MHDFDKVIISLLESDIFLSFNPKKKGKKGDLVLSSVDSGLASFKLKDTSEVITLSYIQDSDELLYTCESCSCILRLNSDSFSQKDINKCTHILPVLQLYQKHIKKTSKPKQLIAKINHNDLVDWLYDYMKTHKPTEMNFKVQFSDQIFDVGHKKEVQSLIKKILITYKSSLLTDNSRSTKGINLLKLLTENAISCQQKKEYYISWVTSSAILDGLHSISKNSSLNTETEHLYNDTIAIINALKQPDLPMDLREEISIHLQEMLLQDDFIITSSRYHFLPILKYCINDDKEFFKLINQKIERTQNIQTTFVLMLELLSMGIDSDIAINYFQAQIPNLHLILWKRILDFLKDTKKVFLRDLFLDKIDNIGITEYDSLLFRFKRKFDTNNNFEAKIELGVKEFEITKNDEIIHKLINEYLELDEKKQLDKLLELINDNFTSEDKFNALKKLNATDELFELLIEENNAISIANHLEIFDTKQSSLLSRRIIELTNEYLDSYAGPHARNYVRTLLNVLNNANKSNVVKKLLKDLKAEFSHRPTLAKLL